MEVILLRILWAPKFFSTINLVELFSNDKNTYVRMTSKNLYKLKESKDNPNNILIKIPKKMFRIIEKLNESSANGKK